jgi:hypothetical protein
MGIFSFMQKISLRCLKVDGIIGAEVVAEVADEQQPKPPADFKPIAFDRW